MDRTYRTLGNNHIMGIKESEFPSKGIENILNDATAEISLN